MTSAVEIASIEIQGPRTIVAIPIPTACPVVPPGNGRLNIITTNENAEKTESNGIVRVSNSFFTRCKATYQKGAAPAYKAEHVEGLRYPSGICMLKSANPSRHGPHQ